MSLDRWWAYTGGGPAPGGMGLIATDERGSFVVRRHGEGRKYWEVWYPDGSYTHNALTQAEAKAQAEAWEPDSTLVTLDELDGQEPLTRRRLVDQLVANAEPHKPTKQGYGYTSTGGPQQKALGALVELRALREAVDAAIFEQAQIARTNTSTYSWATTAATWAEIGEALGVTKQSAQARFASK